MDNQIVRQWYSLSAPDVGNLAYKWYSLSGTPNKGNLDYKWAQSLACSGPGT